MFSVMISSAIAGMKSFMVNVEVDVSNGLPGFEIVGMAAGEVKEAKERVRVALKNIGIVMPPKKITVNLSPASIRKTGTALDLPIAVGILTSMEILPPDVGPLRPPQPRRIQTAQGRDRERGDPRIRARFHLYQNAAGDGHLRKQSGYHAVRFRPHLAHP